MSLRQLIDCLHRRRIAVDAEFLLGNQDGAALQVALDFPRRASDVGHLVGAKSERLPVRRGESATRVVPVGLRLQAVRLPEMRRCGVRRPAGRQEDGRRHSHRALMREQDGVGTTAVADVLVNVYDRLRTVGTDGRALHGRPQQRNTRGVQKLASRRDHVMHAAILPEDDG